MMNKISSAVSVGRTQTGDERQNSVGSSGKESSASVSAPKERDDLVLTGTAKQILATDELMPGVAEIDRSKVERIKLALEAGNYEVSAQRIASKLVEMEKL